MAADIRTLPPTISERDLAEGLSEVLDRVAKGERIIVERAGTAIAVLEPAPPNKTYWTWGEFVYWLQHDASFDEKFARNVREVRESQGSARAAAWPD